MCGFLIGNNLSTPELKKGLINMAARGPDHSTMSRWGEWLIGYNRLAIVDPFKGNQPLVSSNGNIEVIFNGEIYNATEILNRFPECNQKTRNDGEAIIVLYQQFGISFSDNLEGMYTIALYDRSLNELFITRDRIGIKPLVYLREEGEFVASSMIPACPARLQSRLSMFPAGITLAVSSGKCRKSVPFIGKNRGSFKQALMHAVKMQIPQGVSWGVMLSGGIDSSSIASIASKLSSEQVIAYTLDFGGGGDRSRAELVASHLHLCHHIVQVNKKELEEAIKTVIRFCGLFDQGIIINAAATHLVCRAARRHGVKVLLSGEGADELLAGYDEYAAINDEDLEKTLQLWQNDLGSSECLRLDIGSMASSIEVRVPFLDGSVIDHASHLPVERKRVTRHGNMVSKIELRQSFCNDLPEAIVNATKLPFHQGAGLSSVLKELVCTFNPDCLRNYDESVQSYLFHIWKEMSFQIPCNPNILLKRRLWRKF